MLKKDIPYPLAGERSLSSAFEDSKELTPTFSDKKPPFAVSCSSGEVPRKSVLKSFLKSLYQRLNFLWRFVATSFCYFLFGAGGIVMSLTVFPLLALCSKDKGLHSKRVRSVICHTFKLYLSMIKFMGILSITARGIERLKNMQGKLIICNHPSLLDVVIIMSHINNVQCLVKSKLWLNPFVGRIVKAAGYIPNDIDPQSFLQQCKQMLTRGENIIIFPEGTRSVPGQKIKMGRGVANLALCAETGIQALTLTCSSAYLIKGAKWYQMPARRPAFLLEVGPEFSCKNYPVDLPRSILVRALMRDIHNYYNR